MNTTKQSVIGRLLAALERRSAARAEKKSLRARSLRVETLENRELLSATDLLSEVASVVSYAGEADSAYYSVEASNDETIDVSTVADANTFVLSASDSDEDAEDSEIVNEIPLTLDGGEEEFVGTVVGEVDVIGGEEIDIVGGEEIDVIGDEEIDIVVPAAPSDITFGVYDLENHTVPMYWVDNSDNEDGFRVEFSTDGGENWYASQKGAIGADVTERIATGVYTNHTYDFRICAYNAAGDSEYAYTTYTPLESVTTCTSVPVVGSKLTATVVPADATADFAWYVSEDKINWSEEPIATTNYYTPTVYDSNCYLKVVVIGTDYYFGQVSTITERVLSKGPAAPSDVVLGEYNLETGVLPMSWTLNSQDETQVVVQYTIDGGKTWRDGAVLKAGTESRDARIVRVGQTYQFRVCAVGEYGASDWAYSETFVPTAEVASISVSCSAFEVGAKLTTSLTSNAAFSVGSVKASYEWSRSADGENWTAIGWKGSSYTISADDVGCYLKVAATGKDPYYHGTVEYVTEEVVPGVPSAPAAPSDVTVGAYDVATGKLTMNWKLNSTNETSVNVQYSIDGGATWRTSATLKAGSESRTANVVRVGQSYQFRVNTSNANGESDWAYSDVFYPKAEVVSVGVSGELSVGSKLTTEVESNAVFAVGSVKVDYAWQRSADGETWEAIGWSGSSYTISGNDSGCYLKVVVSGKGDYYYGSAEYITEVVQGELEAPAAPSDVTLGEYNLETGSLPMSWTLNSTNETSINVQYTIDGGATWRTSAVLKAGTESRDARIVRVGQTYQFRVNASNAVGTSDWAYSEIFVPKAEVVSVGVSGELTVGSKLTTEVKSNAVFSVGSVKADYAWYRSADGETWEAIGWSGSSYTLKSADANCYVKVVATGKGDYYYGSVEFITEKIEREKVAPAAPSGFTFGEYYADSGELEMWWTLNSDNEDVVSVQYSIDGCQNWLVAAELGAGTETRVGQTVRVGNIYQYRVCASNQYGVSDWAYSRTYIPFGEIDSVTLSYSSLSVGSEIKAEAGTNAMYIVGKVDAGYEWFRSVDGENWESIGATDSTYTIQTADIGCYLKAVATGQNAYYGSFDAETEERILASVDGVVVEGEAKYGATLTAKVTPEDAVVSYEWLRSADGENWESIGATEASYTIQKADSNCYLKVVATGVEVAGYAGEVFAVTDKVVGVPAAPSDVILGEYNRATGELPMSWTLNSTDEIAIGVEYSIDGGETWITSEKTTTTLPAGTTSRMAQNVRVGLQYRFRVCAKGELGDSEWAYSEIFTPTASLTEVTTKRDVVGVGDVVEATLKTDAAFRYGDVAASYAWYRSKDGETWEKIGDASSYTTTVDDFGYTLKVVATGSGVYDGSVETFVVVSYESPVDEVFANYDENDWNF